MTTQEVQKQEFTFQAEIKELLHLLSQSLYQHRDIAIRELISNASDALSKLRHIQLTEAEFRDEAELKIELIPDADAKALTISDNGIGMTHEELVSHLGTIAKSGSLEFLNRIGDQKSPDLSVIGQFGVGFYSAFMIADRVEVLTRSYREEQGWKWESDGSGVFTIQPEQGLPRGTSIRLHLRKEYDEYTEPAKLREIVARYSSFVPQPIRLTGETLNSQRPIWVEPKSQLTEEDYQKFYEHLTHVGERPLWHLHFSSDSPHQLHSILYCPTTNYEKLGLGVIDHGIRLCAKRILVQADCQELLPDYLRFVYGIVDSADLPLNVSRETLQDHTLLPKIRKALVKKVLDYLAAFAEDHPDQYETFYREFGTILRSGAVNDFENRDKITKLLKFQTTSSEETGRLTTLSEYVKRIREDQTQIYYFCAADRAVEREHPHLEPFRARNLEVLWLNDPVDEFVLAHIGQFEDKRLISIDSSDVEFPKSAAPVGRTAEIEGSGFQRLLDLFREAIGNEVDSVRASDRLVDSPCCLVSPPGAFSAPVEKILKMNSKEFQAKKKILELNPSSPLIKRLGEISINPENAHFINEVARQLLADALLMDGLLDNPRESVRRSERFMLELASGRSMIIGS